MTAETVDRMKTTMQQMERVIRALDDLRDHVLPQNPQLFATLAEAPLDDLNRLRDEVHGFLHDLTPSS
jgi:hypothetical protein